MSKIIIEKNMGGKLEVHNEKDGAEFVITLCGLCRLSSEDENVAVQECILLAEV